MGDIFTYEELKKFSSLDTFPDKNKEDGALIATSETHLLTFKCIPHGVNKKNIKVYHDVLPVQTILCWLFKIISIQVFKVEYFCLFIETSFLHVILQNKTILWIDRANQIMTDYIGIMYSLWVDLPSGSITLWILYLLSMMPRSGSRGFICATFVWFMRLN